MTKPNTHLRRAVTALTLAGVSAFPASAADVALVLGNENYSNFPVVRDAGTSERYSRALDSAGFDVIDGRNQDAAALQQAAEGLLAKLQRDDDPDRIVVVLAGHFAHSDTETWLLGRDAREPSAFTAGAQGLALSPLLDVMAATPGQAVLMLASAGGALDLGQGLEAGPAEEFDLPQGVTLVRGNAQRMLGLLQNGLLEPGVTYGDAIDAAGGGVTVDGFVSYTAALIPDGVHPARTPPPERADTGELAYWAAARDIGTIEALRNYLQRYPQGDFVAEANQMIREIREAPARRAEEIESALNLSRDARRQIQRNLSLIGYDPRGIDGVFGPGSRAAISKWQGSAGLDVTGYLTADQINLLQRNADRRAAELEEEARQRREIEERQDRAYWQDTGRGGDEAGLRAYLKKYPDGVYAEVAQSRLDEIEARRRAEAREAERSAWDSARAGDSIASYRSFLDSYPKSGFAEAAQQRIDELEGRNRNSAQIEADKRDEAAIASTSVARLLIEKQLERLGTKPGAVDGNFDQATRRAIRRFQNAQRLPVTGHVSQSTMVRLMAGALR